MALDSHNSTATLRFKGFSPNDLLNRNPEALHMRNEQIVVRATQADREKFRKKVEALEDLGLGNYVRISRLGRQFQKEASRKSYSLEIFRIIKLRPPTLEDAPCVSYYYFIEDMQGEEIRGAFKRNELMKVSPHPNSEGFKFTITEWNRKKTDRQKYIIKIGGKFKYDCLLVLTCKSIGVRFFILSLTQGLSSHTACQVVAQCQHQREHHLLKKKFFFRIRQRLYKGNFKKRL